MSEQQDHDTHYQTLSGTAGQEKIAELVKDIHIAMMTTVAKDGTMNSRPMAVQNAPFDGKLWFLARSDSGKVEEVVQDEHVTLTFAEPKSSKYIAIKGKASASQDRGKIRELWSPMYKAWFPGGENDPQIVVIGVEVTEADYWEASDSKLVVLLKYAAASLTNGKIPVGESGHIAR
jgi:general stress protein 26